VPHPHKAAVRVKPSSYQAQENYDLILN